MYKRGWAESYIHSYSHPHRQLLAGRMSAYVPFSDVLEIGCASGPNLFLLSQKFSNVRYVGIDINPRAIKEGNRFFRARGIHDISLFVGKADDLEGFSDQSFDIVFTDAVLMYVGPDKIKKVAAELERVSRKAIILVEHHSENETDLGRYGEKWWLRNYTKLFQPYSNQITATKITSETWGGNWGKFGYIIEVKR